MTTIKKSAVHCRIRILIIFVQNFNMETQSKNTAMAWVVFFLSTAAFLFAIYAHFEYLTLILPIMCTSFVKAMDII